MERAHWNFEEMCRDQEVTSLVKKQLATRTGVWKWKAALPTNDWQAQLEVRISTWKFTASTLHWDQIELEVKCFYILHVRPSVLVIFSIITMCLPGVQLHKESSWRKCKLVLGPWLPSKWCWTKVLALFDSGSWVWPSVSFMRLGLGLQSNPNILLIESRTVMLLFPIQQSWEFGIEPVVGVEFETSEQSGLWKLEQTRCMPQYSISKALLIIVQSECTRYYTGRRIMIMPLCLNQGALYSTKKLEHVRTAQRWGNACRRIDAIVFDHLNRAINS
jgi:hypothetical protein